HVTLCFSFTLPPRISPLFPYTTLFRSYMSSALLCADLALDNPFVFVPQAKPDLLRKRLPNLSKLAGVTLGSRLEIRGAPEIVFRDRKSTRLNSSHVAISYAVFCLKKKN